MTNWRLKAKVVGRRNKKEIPIQARLFQRKTTLKRTISPLRLKRWVRRRRRSNWTKIWAK